MFSREQTQYIINALDQEIRRTGLQTASFALGIVAQLQAEAQEQSEPAPPPPLVAEPQTEPEVDPEPDAS